MLIFFELIHIFRISNHIISTRYEPYKKNKKIKIRLTTSRDGHTKHAVKHNGRTYLLCAKSRPLLWSVRRPECSKSSFCLKANIDVRNSKRRFSIFPTDKIISTCTLLFILFEMEAFVSKHTITIPLGHAVRHTLSCKVQFPKCTTE